MAYHLARKFSTSAHQTVQLPIQLFGIEGRYATALYSASVKMKQLDAVEKDVYKLQKILNTDKIFCDFLKDPVMNKATKSSALKNALTKLNVSEPMKGLIDVMGKNGQLHRTAGVIAAMDNMFEASKGIVKCIITSARPLDEAAEKELSEVLQLFVEKNQKLNIEKKINGSLIGGITVSIGDKFVDMSIARKIRNYHELMEKALC